MLGEIHCVCVSISEISYTQKICIHMHNAFMHAHNLIYSKPFTINIEKYVVSLKYLVFLQVTTLGVTWMWTGVSFHFWYFDQYKRLENKNAKFKHQLKKKGWMFHPKTILWHKTKHEHKIHSWTKQKVRFKWPATMISALWMGRNTSLINWDHSDEFLNYMVCATPF